MYYVDQRLSKILSDIRIEEARSRTARSRHHEESERLKRRVGLWLIAHGETLAGDDKAKAA